MDKHRMRVGFAGDNREIEVELPKGDIAPWDLDTEHDVVGTDLDRVDAVAKVTGKARYTHDQNPPGLIHGLLVRSPHAKGKVKALDLEAAKNAPGVHAVLPTKKVGARVRFVGDDVVAIAADTMALARDAAALVKVEYEIERHVTDLRECDDAPELDEQGDVVDDWPDEGNDDLEAALAKGATQVAATYDAEVQTHSALEPHGAVAWWHEDSGELDVWISTQGVGVARQGLARANELPVNKVRVRAEYVGGGFGAKFPPGAEGLWATRLSMETKRPVKLMLDRFEEHTCAGNRPSAIMQVRAAADATGKLTAWDYRSWGGPGFAGRGGRTSYPTYYMDHLVKAAQRNTQKDLVTDTDAGRAMRAPGRPQGFFAAEGVLDELATKLGLDPLAVRLVNDPSPLRQTQWRQGAEAFGWTKQHNAKPGEPRDADRPWLLQGAGLSSATWGQMGRGSYRATCRIHQDGTVEIRSAAQDIGTGLKSLMAAITAEELGIDLRQVRAVCGDSQDPAGPASGGSTTTPSLAPAIRHAAALAKQELVERLRAEMGEEAKDLTYEDGHLRIAGSRKMSFVDACRRMGAEPVEATGRRFPNYDGYQDHICGCQFAAVDVDARTGTVSLRKMLAVQDCGLVLAKKLAESQVLGGMIQGASYALFEQRLLEHRQGRMVNGDLLFYKIASAADVPELEVIMTPVANGKNNVGAAGLGEAPATAPAAAVHNAVANAIGVPVRSLPITPDKVLKALAKRGV